MLSIWDFDKLKMQVIYALGDRFLLFITVLCALMIIQLDLAHRLPYAAGANFWYWESRETEREVGATVPIDSMHASLDV